MTRLRFGLRHLLLVIAATAFCIATFTFSGGHLIYPPLLLLFGLGAIAVRQVLHVLSLPEPISRRNAWKAVVCLIAFGTSACLYLPFFHVVTEAFANNQTLQMQRQRIIELDNLESVRRAGRQLQSAILNLPKGERIIACDWPNLDPKVAALIPKEISDLDPLFISASETGISLSLYRNYEKGFGIVIYPENSDQQRGDEQLIDGVWLVESPKY